MVRCLVLSSSLGAVALLFCAFLGACGGDDGGGEDAAIDTPPTACGSDAFFTGEIIDWNANDASFCGVFSAALTVRDDPTRRKTTAPNGRFELCVVHAAQTVVDVAPSTTPSQCLDPQHLTDPDYAYVGPAVFIAPQAIVDSNPGVFSARAMTKKTQREMFAQIDPSNGYDASKAQLVVHVAGGSRTVSIASSTKHAASQAFGGTAWAPGDTGTYVFFPNADPGSTLVTVSGNVTGAGMVDLASGTYTYLTVIAK